MAVFLLITLLFSVSYCQRIGRHDFWGGESELLVSFLHFKLIIAITEKRSYVNVLLEQVLSKLCKQPIIVYIPEHEVKVL